MVALRGVREEGTPLGVTIRRDRDANVGRNAQQLQLVLRAWWLPREVAEARWGMRRTVLGICGREPREEIGRRRRARDRPMIAMARRRAFRPERDDDARTMLPDRPHELADEQVDIDLRERGVGVAEVLDLADAEHLRRGLQLRFAHARDLLARCIGHRRDTSSFAP